MSGQYTLPTVLDPHADESLAGFVMRCNAPYRFDDPRSLFDRLGFDRHRPLPAITCQDPMSPDGQAALRLLNVPEDRWRTITQWGGEPNTTGILGNAVSQELTDTSIRSCCPTCLAEKPYHRAVWLVSAIPACAVHGNVLLRSCPACKAPLRWRGTHLARCPGCNFDLATAASARVTDGELSSIRSLVALLSGASHPAGYGFGDAVKACLVLGRFRLGLPTGREADGVLNVRRESLPATLEAGWATIDPWPAAMGCFLDSMLSGAEGRSAKGGLVKAYGRRLVRLVTRAAQERWSVPVMSEMVDHLVGHPAISVRASVVRQHGSGRNERDRLLTAEEAADLVGVDSNTLIRLMSKLRRGGKPRAAWEQHRFRRADMEQLKQRREDGLNQEETAAMLGTSRLTLVSLVQAGVLTEVPPDRRLRDSLSFSRREIEGLLHSMERIAEGKPRITAPTPDYRSLCGGRDGVGVLNGIPAMLAGKLVPAAVLTTHVGFRRYLFPRVFPTEVLEELSPKAVTGARRGRGPSGRLSADGSNMACDVEPLCET